MDFLFLRPYSFYFQPSSLLKHSKKSFLGVRCSKKVLCQGRKVLQIITLVNMSQTMLPWKKYSAWLDHNTWPECSRLAHTFAYISSKHLYWSQSFNASDFCHLPVSFFCPFVCFTARNFTLGNYPSTTLYLPRIYWREVARMRWLGLDLSDKLACYKLLQKSSCLKIFLFFTGRQESIWLGFLDSLCDQWRQNCSMRVHGPSCLNISGINFSTEITLSSLVTGNSILASCIA